MKKKHAYMAMLHESIEGRYNLTGQDEQEIHDLLCEIDRLHEWDYRDYTEAYNKFLLDEGFVDADIYAEWSEREFNSFINNYLYPPNK